MSKYVPYATRDPIKNYFPLPNDIFCLNFSPGAFAVYSFLMKCEDRKTHQCYPSYKTIGNAVDMCPNTVRKCVGELEDKHLIRTERTTVTTKAGQKRNGNLKYTICPIEEAIRHQIEKQMTIPLP